MYIVNNLKKKKQNNKRLQFDKGHNVVPIECGHNVVPIEWGHNVVPIECGHKVVPIECGHNVVPIECGHNVVPIECGHNVVPIECTKTKLLFRRKRPLIFLILTQLHVSFDNDHYWAIITKPQSKVK
jgi:hypothetical protein